MKHCSRCNTSKPFIAFSKCSSKRDGLQTYCRGCRQEYAAEWYAENSIHVKQVSAAWLSTNKERKKLTNTAWQKANPGRTKQYTAKWYAANAGQVSIYNASRYALNTEREKQRSAMWAKKNSGLVSAFAAAYRAAKLQATPPWVDLKEIEKIYIKAAAKGLTVDHEVPLQGKGVRGLHVPWNLQLLTQSENSRKGNRY